MSLMEVIRGKIDDGFEVHHLDVLNESDQHAVPPGSETHIRLTLVSPDFEGLALVRRHQAIYGLLKEELLTGVHALALHLYTPAEWAARGGETPESPACQGGSKSDPA